VPPDDTRCVGGKDYTVRLISYHHDPYRAFAVRLYEAWDPLLQRQVALKEAIAFQHNKRGQDFLAHARDEARLLAKVGEQRNLPIIYDVVEEENRVWLVMEFVKGSTLSDLCIRPDARPPSQEGIVAILDIILDVCRALQVLHRNHIGHRDVSPSNIIVGKRGAKLVDVGLAVWPSRRAYQAWDAGEGTRGYRAPEQTAWRGPLTIPGRASDVYSLGALLYRLLTASPLPPLPPGASPPLPSTLNPAVSPVLDELVVAALAHNPKDRPKLNTLYRKLRSAQTALREVSPAPVETIPAIESDAAATAQEKTISVGEQKEPPLGIQDVPLGEAYNEGLPKPPSLPAAPPPPKIPTAAMPTSAERARARQMLTIVVGVIVACLMTVAGCVALAILFEIISRALAG